MSKLESEDVLRLLQNARPDQVEAVALPDGSVEIHFTLEKRVKKGKWTKVAEQMAEENFLGDGRGDRLRKAIREFRGGFCVRDVFTPFFLVHPL